MCSFITLVKYDFQIRTLHADIYHPAGAQVLSGCPGNVHWNDDGLERDLYIQTTTVTVLAMDGRRRWLDIQKLVSAKDCHY